jgi:hypothetical protein
MAQIRPYLAHHGAACDLPPQVAEALSEFLQQVNRDVETKHLSSEAASDIYSVLAEYMLAACLSGQIAALTPMRNVQNRFRLLDGKLDRLLEVAMQMLNSEGDIRR